MVTPSSFYDKEVASLVGKRPEEVMMDREAHKFARDNFLGDAKGKVFRLSELIANGMITEDEKDIVIELAGKTELIKVYLSAEAFTRHCKGYELALIVFTESDDGTLSRRVGTVTNPAATSYAAPNALVRELHKDLNQGSVLID
jgi:hypothetical protein